MTATVGTANPDTGDLLGTVDLSDHAGTTAYLRFVFTVPEYFVGPGFVQLDNVRITAL
jgi:hypothetical protein